jgi:EpsI family protein
VLTFPLAFLFFMVPIGDFLLPVLMEATANFTISAVQLSGVPVYREGLQFVIPTGSWSVVEACSGVRYLIASFMVGTLFAYLNYRSTRRRLVFAAVSIAVPIVANWLRAYMIVMLGHLSSNRIATGVDHLLYGWVFFGVVILLMFLIGARWSEPDAAPTGAQAEDRPAPAPATGPAARWIVAALVVAAAAWPQLAADRIEHQVRPGTPDLVLPANLPGGWAREPAAADGYRPVYVGPVTETGALYRSGERLVGVHIAYFRAQGPGRKLVSSDNVLVRSNNHDWNLVSQEAASIDVDGRAVGFRRAQVLGGGITRFTSLDRYEVRQLHWVAGRWVSSLQWAAAIGVLDRLAGHGDDAAGVVIHTARVEGRDASKDLDDFMRQHLASIEATLAAARTSP